MEDCLADELSTFNLLSPQRVYFVLQSESRHLELTKSLLNLIHNIVKVQSVEPTERQKQVFGHYEELVWQLLHPGLPLSTKKRLLEENVPLVVAVAESCPL